MQGKLKEDWMELCEQVAVERDTARLLKLVRELNQMLDEKEQRLERKQPASDGGSATITQRPRSRSER